MFLGLLCWRREAMLIVEAMCLNANRLMRGVCVDASGDMKGGRGKAQGELGCWRKPKVGTTPDYKCQ